MNSDQYPMPRTMTLEEALSMGASHHRAGRLPEARALYEAVLRVQPRHALVNHNLGVLRIQQQQPSASLPFFMTATDAEPGNAQYWLSYLDALLRAGQPAMVEKVLARVSELGFEGEQLESMRRRLNDQLHASNMANEPVRPPSPPGLGLPGMLTPGRATGHAPSKQEESRLLLSCRQGRWHDAERGARELITRYPQCGFVWKMLGISLQQLGRPLEALAAMRMAVSVSPHDVEGLKNLGICLQRQGLLKESESVLRQGLSLQVNSFEIHNTLGITLFMQGRFREAEACYRTAVSLKPSHAEAFNNLGNAQKEQGKFAEAEVSYRRALRLNSRLAPTYNNLGLMLAEQGRLIEAEKVLRQALELQPEYGNGQVNLAAVLRDCGDIEGAELILINAIRCNPQLSEAYDDLLFLLNYHPDRTADEIFSVYREYERQWGLPFKGQWREHANSRQKNRRLRLGYVSPSFYKHSCRAFLEPLLAGHDKSQFEVVAYAELASEDEVTARYRSYVDKWVSTRGMTDASLAERVRQDEIDILIDLAGHTGGNRLRMFAHKPAPVSVHWLDFGYTTGLNAIDYYVTDEQSVPTGSESLFSEKPWRIDTPALVYRPADGMGEVNPLPALENGYVTFGTLTRAVRINYRTIQCWAAILHEVQNSRLIVNSRNFSEAGAIRRLTMQFEAAGIEPDRLAIGYLSPPWDVMRRIDIALDCFPHNSGTTLIEGLYLGIPFVTLAGRASVGRLGYSILASVGHPEWVAQSEQDYQLLAVRLASDLPKLARIREVLREELKASALMDEVGFVRNMESAFRQMFVGWADKTGLMS